jgi:hypothetical protein
MAPPVVRDVALVQPRSGSVIRLLEAFVTCRTGRDAEPCTVVAEYGETAAYGATSTPSPAGGYHQVRLGDLEPGRTYHYRLVATQTGGAQETTTTQDYAFAQTDGPVPPEPVVAGVAVDQLTATGARVTWTTAEAEPAGQVNYGVGAPGGQTASETGTERRTAHAVALAGLTAATEYTYAVFQPGWRGNSHLTAPATFTTPAAAGGTGRGAPREETR